MFKIKNQNTINIALVGVCRHIGVTSQALFFLQYLNKLKKSVAYIELNNNMFLENMKKLYEDILYDEKNKRLIYKNMKFYESKNYENVKLKEYDYLVKDYGAYTDKDFQFLSFLEQDIKIIVAGSKPNEIFLLEKLLEYRNNNFIYIFNFVPEFEKNLIKEMLEEEGSKVYFSDINEDMFDLKNSQYIYKMILK